MEGNESVLKLHLFFADDLLLFGEGTERQAEVMKEVMEDFCVASGHKVNPHK